MNILKNPHFIFDVHVTEVVDASLSVIAQTFMDACTKSEHKLSRVRREGGRAGMRCRCVCVFLFYFLWVSERVGCALCSVW